MESIGNIIKFNFLKKTLGDEQKQLIKHLLPGDKEAVEQLLEKMKEEYGTKGSHNARP